MSHLDGPAEQVFLATRCRVDDYEGDMVAIITSGMHQLESLVHGSKDRTAA